jgi:hypothetical protein
MIRKAHRRSRWQVQGISFAISWATISCTATMKMVFAQEPAYPRGTGPTVLIDMAHHNLDAAGGRVSRASWLEEDGYLLRELTRPFDHEALDGVQIVVIKGALSAENALRSDAEIAEVWRLPTPSAFTPEEIAIIRDWVVSGGALLLVIDHMPISGAAQLLARAFGIEVSNGFVVDTSSLRGLSPKDVALAGDLTFRRADETLAEHPVTNGRGIVERIDSVLTFAGSAFRLPPQGRSLLALGPTFFSLLPDVAWEFSETTPREPVEGWSQGGVLRVGRGRLAVFADVAILVSPDMVAEYAHPEEDPVQNPQFLLNVLHWLSGLLDEPE